jgi:hypothetical protein
MAADDYIYRLHTAVTADLYETPNLARPYCPGCEPDADPNREILEVRWCDPHRPTLNGIDDTRVTGDAVLSGNAEAGGDENRRWCEMIHREIRGAKGRSKRPRISRSSRKSRSQRVLS